MLTRVTNLLLNPLLGPLEKLSELIEDIFEAEDSLPADGGDQPSTIDSDQQHQLTHFFSRLTINYSYPLLSTSIIAKLTRAISQVARPAKRLRVTSSRDGTVTTPLIAAGLSDLEVGTFSRVLKLLSRSVKLGEDLDVFAGPPPPPASALPDVKPGGKGKKAVATKKSAAAAKKGRSRSHTPREGEKDEAGGDETMDVEHDEQQADMGVTEEALQQLEKQLQMAKESVLAADACLALLSADKLPKQVRKGVDLSIRRMLC